jgi:hypothetical protein
MASVHIRMSAARGRRGSRITRWVRIALLFFFFMVSGAHDDLGGSVAVNGDRRGGDVARPATAPIRGSTPSHSKDEKLGVAMEHAL